MSAGLTLSYWPARRRRPGPISSTKVRRVCENRPDELNLIKRDGCAFNCLLPVVEAAAEAAAVADCFVEPRVDGKDSRQQAGAKLGEPCCSSSMHNNTGEPRWASSCIKCRRGPVCALRAVALGLQAATGVVRASMMVACWFRVALLLLLLPTPAGAAVDLALYGGAFDSSSIIAYAEV